MCDGTLWESWFRSLLTVLSCLWFLLGLCSSSYTKSSAAFMWFISLLEHKEALFVYCLQLKNCQTFLIRTINIIEWDDMGSHLPFLQLLSWWLIAVWLFVAQTVCFPFSFSVCNLWDFIVVFLLFVCTLSPCS